MAHEKSFVIYHKKSGKYINGITTYKNGVKNSINGRHYNRFYQAANFVKGRLDADFGGWEDVTINDFEIHEVEETITSKFSVDKSRKNEELTPKVIVFGKGGAL